MIQLRYDQEPRRRISKPKHQQPVPSEKQDFQDTIKHGEGEAQDASASDDHYWQKVDYLADIVFEADFAPKIADLQATLLGHVRGTREEVLSSIQSSSASKAKERTREQIAKAETALGDEQDDSRLVSDLKGVVNHIKTDLFVSIDPHGTHGQFLKTTDFTTYAVGREPSTGLNALISQEDEIEISDGDITKVEAVMRVLLAAGQYKLLK